MSALRIREVIMRHIVLLTIALLLLPTLAAATVPATDPDMEQSPHFDGGPAGTRDMPPSLAPFNYLREFDQIVEFLAIWQLNDPDSTDHGGEIEAEAGYLGDVIQTDNTLEAIWCWARYKQVTGSSDYDDEMARAWIYCTNFPAWQEEGGFGDDYYRVHNCAWGLTAVLMYRAATGDHSYDAYAETCAQYIVDHPLNIWDGTMWNQRLDTFCKGWAAGNLYIYGEAVGNPAFTLAATSQGLDVFNWLDVNPAVNLTLEYWAMSSGTALWGVCNSYFAANPLVADTWLGANAQHLDLWQDWYSVPGYDWDSSWNVAYGNAHFAVYDILGDPQYAGNAKAIFDALLSYDTDDDGGIQAETMDPVTEDMTWVTNYLCKFGVDRLMGDPAGDDVGVLRFVGLDDGDDIPHGTPIDISILSTNFGLNPQVGVPLTLTGDWGGAGWARDLPFVAMDTLFVDTWLPPESGTYTLTAATNLPGDQDPTNDSVSVTFDYGMDLVNAPGALFASPPRPLNNPFTDQAELRLSLAKPADLRLEIFDVAGRRVATPHARTAGIGEQILRWNGVDAAGRPLPAGIYLYRVTDGTASHRGKLLKLR